MIQITQMGNARNFNSGVHNSPNITFYEKKILGSLVLGLEIHGFTGTQGTRPNAAPLSRAKKENSKQILKVALKSSLLSTSHLALFF